MAARNYRDIIAWQKSMELCVAVYKASERFPKEERFGLINQWRRAAVSIPSNIAEGQGRGTDREWRQYLRIAYGSLREVETQALLAERLGYLEKRAVDAILEIAAEVGRLINGLMQRLAAD